MRTLRLIRIAAEAEKLHLQARLGRSVRQAAMGAAAAIFALCALGLLHAIGYIALRDRFSPIASASIVFGVDVVLAAILGLVASRGGESVTEREAREVREHALVQLREAATLFGVIAPVGRLVGKRGVYGMTLAALTARFLSSR
jgi:hypothetical protein